MQAPFDRAFVASVEALLGAQTEAFLRALEEPYAAALRVHRPCAQLVRFIGDPVPWAREAYYVLPGTQPGASIAHWAGSFYLQEASAMLSAAALMAQPGERVLDLCAAPGGKASQIGRDLQGEGVLVANEPHPGRAQALAGNLERLGVANAVVTCETPERLAAAWPEAFDAVLVDAPCSGEGMFRREAQARAQWTAQGVAGCARRQGQILAAAARMVRPGGRLVYSTCTFNAVENEGTIAAFLKAQGEFAPEDFSVAGLGASEGGMLRLWPHLARGDGHFVCRMRRAGASTLSCAPARDDPGAQQAVRALAQSVMRTLPRALASASLRFWGERLFAVPALAPATDGLRVVSPGTALLRARKNRVEPEHALAMAATPQMALRAQALDEVEALRFFAGEAIAREGENGWTLTTFEGLSLGWGKQVDGALKNHLPRGLRRNLRAQA